MPAQRSWRIRGPGLVVRVTATANGPVWEIVPDDRRRHPPVGPSAWPAPGPGGPAVRVSATVHTSRGVRTLRVTTAAPGSRIRLTRCFRTFPDHPFVRMWGEIGNRGRRASPVSGAALLDLILPWADGATLFHVEQFSWTYRDDFFRPQVIPLESGRLPLELRMGSFPALYPAPTSCGWAAVRRGRGPDPGLGIVVGVEFTGKSRLTAGADDRGVRVSSVVDPMRAELPPGGGLELPGGFVGFFHGDWDAAGYATQRFAEQHVHPPPPDRKFPWVMYNSWGYGREIDEAQQLAAVDRCAALGVEAVVLDLGWSAAIGDWRPDPVKFPRGLAPVSVRARQHGMKFGLHVALAQAAPDSTLAKAHPDWLTGGGIDYFGSRPICLGHAPCREWLIRDLIRLIDDAGVDYLVTDGEDLVKRCTRTDHTHPAGGDNRANSVDGLDAVIGALRRARPNVVWENCEGGGCMQTFGMARLFHTSITVDNIATYATRQGVFGASYPFSPRYSVRYMQDAPTPYTLRSAMFGGPLVLMQKVGEFTPAQMQRTKAALTEYKRLRPLIRDGKVIHLIPPAHRAEGEGRGWDAIQSVSADRRRSVVLVYRARGGPDRETIRPRGLDPAATYRVRLHDRGVSRRRTGDDVSSRGLALRLAENDSELIEIVRV